MFEACRYSHKNKTTIDFIKYASNIKYNINFCNQNRVNKVCKVFEKQGQFYKSNFKKIYRNSNLCNNNLL